MAHLEEVASSQPGEGRPGVMAGEMAGVMPESMAGAMPEARAGEMPEATEAVKPLLLAAAAMGVAKEVVRKETGAVEMPPPPPAGAD